MSGKHTPGPWTVRPSIKGPYVAPAPLGLESALCKVLKIATGTGRLLEREQEQEANARLIAAAPDLLAALESAPEPPPMPMGNTLEVHLGRREFLAWQEWYQTVRAAALQKVKA